MNSCVICDTPLFGNKYEWFYEEYAGIKLCHECHTNGKLKKLMKFIGFIYK